MAAKRVWNPAHHPRDARGRFTKSATRVLKATDAKRAKAAVAGFKPTDLGPGAGDGKAWLEKQAAAKAAADDAVKRYFAGEWKTKHAALRTQKDAATDPDVVAIDKAMAPLSDDVMLERRVDLKMFAHIPMEQLQGMKVRDAAYQPAALQGSQGEAPDGMVTIHMAVPASTRAIINPETGAVVLDRDTETAISRVEPNGRGGYDLYGIVIPKAGAVKPGRPAGEPAQDDQGAPAPNADPEAPNDGATPDQGDTDTAGGSAAAGGDTTRRRRPATPPRNATGDDAGDQSDAGAAGAGGDDDQGDAEPAQRPRKAAASTAGTPAPGRRRTAAQGGQDAGDDADQDEDAAATAAAAAQVADTAAEHERITGRTAPTRVDELERNDHVRIAGETLIGRTTVTGYVSTPNLIGDQTWVTVSQFPDSLGRRTNMRVTPDTPVYVQPHPDPADVVLYRSPKTGRSAPKATYIEHIRGQVVRDPEREAQAKARIAELSGAPPPAPVGGPANPRAVDVANPTQTAAGPDMARTYVMFGAGDTPDRRGRRVSVDQFGRRQVRVQGLDDNASRVYDHGTELWLAPDPGREAMDAYAAGGDPEGITATELQPNQHVTIDAGGMTVTGYVGYVADVRARSVVLSDLPDGNGSRTELPIGADTIATPAAHIPDRNFALYKDAQSGRRVNPTQTAIRQKRAVRDTEAEDALRARMRELAAADDQLDADVDAAPSTAGISASEGPRREEIVTSLVDRAAPDDETPDGRKAALEAKRAELEQATADFHRIADAQVGGSSKRKSFGVRLNAQLRRAGEARRKMEQLEREIKALERPPAPTVPAGGFTAEQLAGATHVRTRFGWFEVTKVNQKSIKVKFDRGIEENIPLKNVIEFRAIADTQLAREMHSAMRDNGPVPNATIRTRLTKRGWVDDTGRVTAAGQAATRAGMARDDRYTPEQRDQELALIDAYDPDGAPAAAGDDDSTAGTSAPTLDPAEERAAVSGRVFAQTQLDGVADDDTRFRMRRARVGNREMDLYNDQGERLGILSEQPAGWLTMPASGRAGVTGRTFPEAVDSLRNREISPEATPNAADAAAEDPGVPEAPDVDEPPAPAPPAIDPATIAVDDQVRVAGQWATVTAKADGQLRVRFPGDRLALVNPADVRQHRAAVRVEDMFGATSVFVPQDRSTIGVAARAGVGRTAGQQQVQQVSMFDVADQQQITGQTALLDAFLEVPEAPPPLFTDTTPAPPAPVATAAAAPAPAGVDVPEDLTAWTDEQLAGLFAEVSAQDEYDEAGTLRIMGEWERRESEMQAVLALVPDDLTTLDDDAAAELFAEVTSHHGTMDTPTVDRMMADLDRRDAEHRANLADLDAKRALVALPVDQHADDDALVAAMNAAGDLGDEEASVRILDEIDRRDQAQREREAAAAAEAQAREVAEAQARMEADAAAAAEANARAMDAPAEARLIVLEDLIAAADDADDADNDQANRDAPAEPGMADVSKSDLYATVITKLGSPEAEAAQREIRRREAAEARSQQTLENRRARRRLLNRDLTELTEDEMVSLPALLDTLPGEDGAAFREQKLADLQVEVNRRQQELDNKAARRAAGPDRAYRRADPVTEYDDLEYHFNHRYGEDTGRWAEAKELALGLRREPDRFSPGRLRPVPYKEWKKAVQASPRPWPDVAQSALAWYRHLTEIDAPEQAEIEGRSRDFNSHGGWRSQPDVPDLLDPIAPADVAKADMVLYDMRSKAIDHRNNQGDESTFRRYVLAMARAYRIPHNPNASLAELRESGVEKSAGAAHARDPRSPQKAAADVIAEFRRLAAEDGVDPADSERFGPADRKSTARRAARGELTSDQQARIQAHLARGLTWEQAYAQAIGVDESELRRQRADDLIRQAFASTAKDLAEAYKLAYTEHVMAAYQAAEDGTRGHLLNDAGKQLQARGNLSAVELFSGSSTRAYKYASEELKRWWGEHPPPRLTFAEWKASMQGDPSAMAAAIQKAKGNEFA